MCDLRRKKARLQKLSDFLYLHFSWRRDLSFMLCDAECHIARIEPRARVGGQHMPQCSTPLQIEELHSVLPRSIVWEMKQLVTRAALSEENWRWCLARGCGHGAIHDGNSKIATCGKCSAKTCFEHRVPCHVGVTCEEYEGSRQAAAMTEADEDFLKRRAKPCPGCGSRIEKNGGCNRISCKFRSYL